MDEETFRDLPVMAQLAVVVTDAAGFRPTNFLVSRKQLVIGRVKHHLSQGRPLVSMMFDPSDHQGPTISFSFPIADSHRDWWVDEPPNSFVQIRRYGLKLLYEKISGHR